jgi:hypothetical protein
MTPEQMAERIKFESLFKLSPHQARLQIYGYRGGWMSRAKGSVRESDWLRFMEAAKLDHHKQVTGDPWEGIMGAVAGSAENAIRMSISASVRGILGGWWNFHNPANNILGGTLMNETFRPKHGFSRERVKDTAARVRKAEKMAPGKLVGGRKGEGYRAGLGRSGEELRLGLRTDPKELALIEQTQGKKGREKREIEDDAAVFAYEEYVARGTKLDTVSESGRRAAPGLLEHAKSIATTGKIKEAEDIRFQNPEPTRTQDVLHRLDESYGANFSWSESYIRTIGAMDGYFAGRAKGLNDVESRRWGRTHEHKLHFMYAPASKSPFLQSFFGQSMTTLSTWPMHNAAMLMRLGKQDFKNWVKGYISNWGMHTMLYPLVGAALFNDENWYDSTHLFGGNAADWGGPDMPTPIPLSGMGPLRDIGSGSWDAFIHWASGDPNLAKEALYKAWRAVLDPSIIRIPRKAFMAESTTGEDTSFLQRLTTWNEPGQFTTISASGRGGATVSGQGILPFIRESAPGRNLAQKRQSEAGQTTWGEQQIQRSKSMDESLELRKMVKAHSELKKGSVERHDAMTAIKKRHHELKGKPMTKADWDKGQRTVLKEALPYFARSILKGKKINQINALANMLDTRDISPGLWKQITHAIAGPGWKGKWLYSKTSAKERGYRAAVTSLQLAIKRWEKKHANTRSPVGAGTR